ncbi:hypothetical protein B7494_g3829 [Chlorociboria aeruginascens]|nr:hypothetical protein B7494_g3829 [Chlorociboria aeruginascens]
MSSQPNTTEKIKEFASNATNTLADTISPPHKRPSYDASKDETNFEKDDHGNVYRKGDYKHQLSEAAKGGPIPQEASYMEKVSSYIPSVNSLQQSMFQKEPQVNAKDTKDDGRAPVRPDHDVQVEQFLRDQYHSRSGEGMPNPGKKTRDSDSDSDSSKPKTILDCLTKANVPYVVSTSTNWTTLVTPYNLRLFWEPVAISLPVTEQHISDSITCASQYKIKVQAKSGGHSYASYSNGGQNGSLIVNLQTFQSVSVDAKSGIAKVGGGTRIGNLAIQVFAQGNRALPHGTGPAVGVGGHFTHGGYGYSSRLWGLALDSIVALDVILADGSKVHATSTSHPDIFYAMRGAADSFGIVSYFYLQTEPAPDQIINWAVYISNALNDTATLTSAFLNLQSLSLDSTFMNGNISFGIYVDNNASFSISGWCISCDINQFENTTLPTLLTGFPPAIYTSVTSLGWIESLENLISGGPLPVPYGGDGVHDTFYGKSTMTQTAQPLTKVQLDSFWNFVATQGLKAAAPWFTIINLYGGAGSQINVPDPDDSAYSDRDVLWGFQYYSHTASHSLPYDPDITAFTDALKNSITANATNDFSLYLNYVDSDLTPTQALLGGL